MNVLILDLDGTLANLYSVFYYLGSLLPRETIKLSSIPYPDTHPVEMENFEKSLGEAYHRFVALCTEKEASENPIGILRPGLLPMMRRFHLLQEMGYLRGIFLYSNHPFLPALHWVRDMIHLYIGADSLILDSIHGDHPIRTAEEKGEEGERKKTWETVKRMMESFPSSTSSTSSPSSPSSTSTSSTSPSSASSVSPHHVFYMDDQKHEDLIQTLGENVIQVSPYTFRASSDHIGELYRQAVQDVPLSHLIGSTLFLFSSTSTPSPPPPTMEFLLSFLKEKTGPTVTRYIRPSYTGIGAFYQMERRIRWYGEKAEKEKESTIDRVRNGNS
jgi:hypothetical protein